MNTYAEPYRPADARAANWVARQLHRVHIDPMLLSLLICLTGLGLLVLYSAGDQNSDLLWRQAARLGVSAVGMLILAQFPVSIWRRFAPLIFLFGLGLLVAVIFFGDTGGGAKRWLDLKVVRFQPSEIMKLALPIAMAAYLHNQRVPPSPLTLIVALGLLAAPVALIVQQPDLGTSILIASSGVFVLFLAGVRWRYILGALVTIAALAPVLWANMRDYQRQRVLTFMNPESDPLGSGYHIIQSKIAIGSGGLFGKGWMNGTQSQLDFLPERSTDFIFSVAAEEFGLLGLLPLLGLYLAIALRGLYIGAMARDRFSRLLAGGLSLTFFVYVIVNTGMVSGLLPVVGVPLPLISYGGSSMITLFAAFGILMSIHTHKRPVSDHVPPPR